MADRKANTEELDRLVGEWTASQDVGELVTALQNQGIAAGKSQNTLDLISDPTFWARGFYPEITEFDGESKTIVGPGAKMTRGAVLTDGAPKLGDHTDYVLGDILGLSAEEREQLNEEGIMR